MEIELKYLIHDDFTLSKIIEDSHVVEISDQNTKAVLNMHAKYFDTKNGDLRKDGLTFRTRVEGDDLIATVKWDGKSTKGLHVRNELNINVDEFFIDNPNLDLFKGSEIYDRLLKAKSNDKLVPIMEMKFVRNQVEVDTGKSICMLSLDSGDIIVNGKTTKIKELEIELYSGDEDSMIELGEELKNKYNLEPCDVSKYKRGLELLLEK